MLLQKKKSLFLPGKRQHHLTYCWNNSKRHKNETMTKYKSKFEPAKQRWDGGDHSLEEEKASITENALDQRSSETEGDREESWQDTEISEHTIESELSRSQNQGSSSRNSSQQSRLSSLVIMRKEHNSSRRSSTCTDRRYHHSSGFRAVFSRSSAASTRSSGTSSSRAKSRTFPSLYTRTVFTEQKCLQTPSRYHGTSNYMTRPFKFSYFQYYSN